MPALSLAVHPLDRSDGRLLAVVALLTLCLLVFGVHFGHLDFSAGKYLANDAALGHPAEGPFAVYPFNDASGLAHTVAGNAHVAASIAQGELPVWDRMQGGGWSPAVAMSAGVFHPLRWAMAWLPPHLATSGLMVMSTGLAFAGFVLLARTLGSGLPGACATAAAWLLLPHSLVFAQMDGTLIHAFAPWILLGALRSRQVFDAAFVFQALGLALLALSGHPLLIIISGVGMGLFLGLWSLQSRDPGPLARFVLASVFGAALAAFALLPFLAGLASEWNYKTKTPFGAQFQWSDWAGWASLWSGVFRLDPGAVDHDEMAALLRVPAILALLILVALIRGRRDHNTRALAALVLIGLVFAVPGPWGAWLAHLPLLATVKTHYLLSMPLFYACLLAAMALRVPAEPTRQQRWLRTAGGLALLAGSALMLPRFPYWQPAPVSAPHAPAVLASDPQAPFRIVGGLGQLLLPNLASLGSYEDLRLQSPLQHRRYYLYVAIANSLQPRLFPVLSYPLEWRSPLLPKFNVRYAVGIDTPQLVYYSLIDPQRDYRSFRPNEVIAAKMPAGARRIASATPTIMEFPAPRPRAHFAQEPVFSRDLNESAAALLEIQRGTRPASQNVIEADPAAFAGLSFATADSKESIRVAYPGHRSVQVDVLALVPRLLVLNDTFADGWRATLDGAPVPIVPVNLVARGVMVPAGEHRIEMRYTPPGMLVGAALALLAVLLLVAGHRRQRPLAGPSAAR